VEFISQVYSESSIDTKCGLLHDISQGDTVDKLFDVKLALTSFDVRRKANMDIRDELLTNDFVERLRFRLWSGSKLRDVTRGA
jgi:hypothetical protein